MLASFCASPIPCRVCGDRDPFELAGLCGWCLAGGSVAPDILGEPADLEFIDAVASSPVRPPRALTGRC